MDPQNPLFLPVKKVLWDFSRCVEVTIDLNIRCPLAAHLWAKVPILTIIPMNIEQSPTHDVPTCLLVDLLNII
jgi:hypothetical protein